MTSPERAQNEFSNEEKELLRHIKDGHTFKGIIGRATTRPIKGSHIESTGKLISVFEEDINIEGLVDDVLRQIEKMTGLNGEEIKLYANGTAVKVKYAARGKNNPKVETIFPVNGPKIAPKAIEVMKIKYDSDVKKVIYIDGKGNENQVEPKEFLINYDEHKGKGQFSELEEKGISGFGFRQGKPTS